MALKDWKKTPPETLKDKWRKERTKIEIYKLNSHLPRSKQCYWVTKWDGSLDILKETKTKKEALSFAKSYMRRH